MGNYVHKQWSNFLTARGYEVRLEHDALRAFGPVAKPNPALTHCVDLNHWVARTLVGSDAVSFLQGYLTCDTASLDAAHALIGAYCNIKGRVVTDATVILAEAGPMLVMHASIAAPAIASLSKYLTFSRSRFAPVDEAPVLLGIVNPPQSLDLPAEPLRVMPYRGGIAVAMPGPVPRALLALPLSDAQAVWLEHESQQQTNDAAVWDLIDVRGGIAHVQAATSEAFLPQMLDYDRIGAISFRKGCYLGQEIVARTQHLGKAKRHLHALKFDGAPVAIGSPLLDVAQRRAGTVVAVAMTEPDHGDALAVLNDGVTGPLLAADARFTIR